MATSDRPAWPRRTPRVLATAPAVVVIALISIGVAVHHAERYKRFGIHDVGLLYRSSWMSPDAVADKVREHQIRTVVNLCRPDEYPERQIAEREAVESAGAAFHLVTFPKNNTSHATDASFREMEAIFDDPKSYPVLVHCYHGKERTAKALAIYDVRKRRMTAEQSVRGLLNFDRKVPEPILTFVHNYERWCIDAQVQEARQRDAQRETLR